MIRHPRILSVEVGVIGALTKTGEYRTKVWMRAGIAEAVKKEGLERKEENQIDFNDLNH
ncbi:MAG: hypothetical protein MUO58_21640 [Anaerolineales bacterium]|nr:hypothetical protein [Anaerolineales bacterium]HUS84639.1 hypothetical protein [Anaerolineales bacterium]